MAENIFGIQAFMNERNFTDDFANQTRQNSGIDTALGVALVEYIFEFGVFFFDGFERIID